jgi:hypothetical protein
MLWGMDLMFARNCVLRKPKPLIPADEFVCSNRRVCTLMVGSVVNSWLWLVLKDECFERFNSLCS